MSAFTKVEGGTGSYARSPVLQVGDVGGNVLPEGRANLPLRFFREGLLTIHKPRLVILHDGAEAEIRMSEPQPDHILQVALGFWASKTLLSAVEMELFTELAKHPADLDAGI